MAIRCLIFICLLGPAFTSVAAPDQYWNKFDEYSNISWREGQVSAASCLSNVQVNSSLSLSRILSVHWLGRGPSE